MYLLLEFIDLNLRRREAPSRRMAAGSVSLWPSFETRAQERAPQDEVD